MTESTKAVAKAGKDGSCCTEGLERVIYIASVDANEQGWVRCVALIEG